MECWCLKMNIGELTKRERKQRMRTFKEIAKLIKLWMIEIRKRCTTALYVCGSDKLKRQDKISLKIYSEDLHGVRKRGGLKRKSDWMEKKWTFFSK